MKKILAIQIVFLLSFGGGFTGLMYYTDVYDYVQDTIVTTVCLSCIKMYPNPSFSFTFETNDDLSHPGFILDNLTKGPIFLAYRKNVCDGCEIMDPLVEEVFGVDFGLGDYETYVNFEGTMVYFRHVNVDDHKDDEFEYSFDAYGGLGVPMFVAMTLGNNSGTVEPYYQLEYGTLGLHDDSGRKEFLRNMVRKSIEYYDENIDGYLKQ